MLTLEIKYPSGRAETRSFPGPVSIGRDVGDVALDDPQVSAHHAEIQLASEAATYVDLGSTNGSYTVEGEPITTLPLRAGTVICLGTSRITVLKVPGRTVKPTPRTDLLLTTDDVGGGFEPLAPGGEGTFPVPSARPGSTRRPATGPIALLGADGALSIAQAGYPSVDDPFAFLSTCWRDYRKYAWEGTQLLGFLIVPAGLVLGVLRSASFFTSFLEIAVYLAVLPLTVFAAWLLGLGSVQEFALRLAIGQPITHQQAWSIQSRRFVPFFLDTLPAFLMSLVGYAFCIVPGLLSSFYLFPVYLVEAKRGFEPSKRSFALFQVSWRALVPTVLVAAVGGLLIAVLTRLFRLIPVLGYLDLALAALAAAALLPFLAFLQHRTYLGLRQKTEGIAALQVDLALLPRL